MRIANLLIFLLCCFQANSQCPDITQTNVSPNCKPECELCAGDKFTITIQGGDLPHTGKVDYYADIIPGFNPYSGQGIKIGSSNITTSNPKCRVCPVLLGFMIDACGTESKNEFMVIWTGSGLNTSDFNFDYAPQNNTGGGSNADIGPGGCGITGGNPGLVGGCAATSVGSNFNLPPNSIWIVFTSVTAFTNYDFSSVCGLTCKIFVSSSTCDRVIGAFSNFDATPGPRTQVMTITGCTCSTNAMYDIPGSLMGQGDFWAEGSIVNNGCATPSFNAPNYTAATSIVEPFMYTIPANWCDKSYEIVGILNPKPDVICCMEEFTERFTVNVKCPKANSATLEICETINGQASFTLEDANADVLGGSNGTVLYYKDMAGSIKLNSPYNSGNATIYAKIVDGNCTTALVPVVLKVLLLPLAKSTSIELCDDGSGFANFDLTSLEPIIKNGHNAAMVLFFQDINKTIPIISPYTSNSTIIYSSIIDFSCESKPVPITLNVLKKPEAFATKVSSCPDSADKASFNLLDLISKITNNQSGVSVKFYEDEKLIREIFSPYRSGTDTIYAQVLNATCKSEPVAIILLVSALNSIPFLKDKNCDDGNGKALFNVVNLEKILKQNDSTIAVMWYEDSLQMQQLFPPLTITGIDTIFAFLFKDSCKSNYIPIILEAIKRPFAKSFTWNVCSYSGDSVNFDLSYIHDSINQGNGLIVNFFEDSLQTKAVGGLYPTSGDTLYATTLDGNCASLPVKIILNVTKAPSFIKTSDIIVCEYFILLPLNGTDLTTNAAYYNSIGILGNKLNAGDTIKKSGFIYLYDSLVDCIVQDSFYLDIFRKPQAGSDKLISVCEGNLVNLKAYLSIADPGGIFIDLDNSGSLNDSILNSAGHNGSTFRFAYVLNANSYCPSDTSIISISVVKELLPGRDTNVIACEHDIIDLYSLLPNADIGGQFIDLANTGALTLNFWDAYKVGPGTYKIFYEVGDGIVCAKIQAEINFSVQPSIEIDTVGGQIGCDYYVLPSITGKNVNGLSSYYTLPNGKGSKYFPGDTIKNNQRIYIYGEATGYCSDEESFFIIISPPIFGPYLDVPLCFGDSILIGKTYYGLYQGMYRWSGIEKSDIPAANGCDSLYRVIILYTPVSESFLNQTLCEGEFVFVNNTRYDINHSKGLEILNNANEFGCDSTINIDLQFIPTIRSTFKTSLCKGEQTIINGKVYDENKMIGIDTLKNASVNGCDSIVDINILIISPTLFTYRNQICKNDSVVLGNVIFNKNNPSALDTLKGLANNGCDSIRDIQIQFYPEATNNINQTLCDNQSILINGIRYDKNNSNGQEIIKAVTKNGCDSLINISLNFKALVSQNYSDTICENENILINGKYYDKNNLDGMDTLFAQATGGCDSIVRIQVKVLPNKIYHFIDTFCPNEFIVINGKTYDVQNPTGTERISSQLGCDSVVNVEIQFSNLNLSYTSEIFLLPGQSQSLNIIPSFKPHLINWSPAIGLSCIDCLDPVASPTETTTYVVTITDEHDCSITAQITIRLDINDKVFVPNVFSPNGDNINDFFKVISDNLNVLISDFAIYDRWGNQVYFENNKTISNHQGWDGSTNTKEKLNPGVFVYYIRLKIPGGSDKILYGNVSLLR